MISKKSVEVLVDWAKINMDMRRRKATAQAILDLAIIHDTDPLVPMRQGTLAGSAMLSSKVGKGIIVYDTPYARHLYYGINVKNGKKFTYSRAKHPRATERWVEVSKSLYLDKWVKQVRDAYL